ncbi:MAG: glycerol dehydrogenase [Anaerovoracaceae bacterium]|nr:glycerol dehydrogenase [Anaerovoracaceae bacterium]
MIYKNIICPAKYIQGRGILKEIRNLTKHLGERYIFIADQAVMEIVRPSIECAFLGGNEKYFFELHRGESSWAEGTRILEIAKENECDIIVGVGGGKVIDTAKMVADKKENARCVIIPTSAASDAPCSSNSVVYTEEGEFEDVLFVKENPAVVIVDTEIIAKAPLRLLVAGMGDAYATYFEARACIAAGLSTAAGGLQTETAFAMAKLCKELLLKYGKEAKKSVEKQQWSEALEKVCEANIFLSGVGFENTGVSIAHAAYNGLSNYIVPFPAMHGEGVAFGLLLMLAVEYEEKGHWDMQEWDEMISFYKSVGLPTRFEDINIYSPDDQFLKGLAECMMSSSANVTAEPFKVTAEKLYNGLIQIRNIGK